MKNETLTAILNEKDKLSAYMGVGVDYYKGETGKSGADEVYIGAEPPTDPQVKLWVDTEAQSVGAVDWNDVENKPNFATVATSGSYEDLTNKPTIPEPYTLPTATTDTLGGVKVDGETITIADGVISSAGGDLIGKKMKGYNQPESEWTWMADWAQHPEKYYVVVEGISDVSKEGPVICTQVNNNNNQFFYYWFEDETLHRGYINFTDNTLSQVESVNQWPDAGTVWLTEKNRWAYIPEAPDLTPYAKTADLSAVATSGSYYDLKYKPDLFSGDYQDLTNKPTIPEPYTLPTASYNTLGGVKAKQTEPNEKYGIVYIDSDARLRVPIARQGESRNAGIVLPAAGHFKVEDNGDMFLLPASTTIGGVKADGTTTTVDEDGTIHATMPEPYTLPTATTTTLGGVKVDDDIIRINENGTLYVDKTKISASNGLPSGGWYPQILMKNSNNNYDSVWSNISDVLAMAGISIGGGGSDWQITTDTSNSDLYNAKEVVIFWQDSNYNRHQSYLNVGCDYYGNSGNSWGNSNWINTQITLDSVDSSYNGSSITYDGSSVNMTNMTSIDAICYKT